MTQVFEELTYRGDTKNKLYQVNYKKNVFRKSSFLLSKMRVGNLTTKIGTVTLDPTENTHRVGYKNESFFDSFGCPLPNVLTYLSLKEMEVSFFF